MKEIEVDNINLIQNTETVMAYSATGTATYPGLRETKLELTKINPIDSFISIIHDADSLLIISDDGCLKTDNFMIGSYNFSDIADNEDVFTRLNIELVLTEEPLYGENKDQLLLDII